MRKYIDIINETPSGTFFGGKPVFVHGGPAYNPVVTHSPRLFVLYDDNGVEQASILKTMVQAPGAKFSSFSDRGASSHEEFSEAMAAAKAAVGLEGEVEVAEWNDLSPDDKNIILAHNTYADEELVEGWKSALGAAALTTAAITNLSPESYDDMTFRDAFSQAMKDKGEGNTFTWKGKEYKIDTAKSKKMDTPLLRNDAGELIKYDRDGNLIPESDLQNYYENILREEFEEIEEGWKAALGAAAMGAAALAGVSGMGNNATATDQPNTQLSSIQPMKFSPEAEQAAKQAGYQSAEAMYYFLKQQNKGATVEVDAFDRALSDAKGASMIHPGNLLGYVADKMGKATNNR